MCFNWATLHARNIGLFLTRHFLKHFLSGFAERKKLILGNGLLNETILNIIEFIDIENPVRNIKKRVCAYYTE